MNQIDRLIAKAKKMGLGEGDVFLVSGETGTWRVGDKEFPDVESAEQYVDTLIDDSDGDFTVIINDITPEYLEDLKVQIREADRKRDREEMRRKRKAERKRQRQKKRRRLQEQEHLEREHQEKVRMEKEKLMEIDEDRQLI